MFENIIYGIHAVSAVIKSSHRKVQKIIISQDRCDKRIQELLSLAELHKVDVERESSSRMAVIFPGDVHQGVIAYAEKLPQYTESDIEFLISNNNNNALILILDGITDPHNLGACLRVADAAGVDFIIIPKDKSVKVTPVVSKVASGAAEFIPLIPVTNLARTIKKLKSLAVWIYGTHIDAKDSIYAANMQGPTALVLGAEGSGMRRLTTENCDALYNIPMYGSVNSLNVSVACGVCLYEAVRQRR